MYAKFLSYLRMFKILITLIKMEHGLAAFVNAGMHDT